MSKYQKYTEYKDSGVRWLGDIPNHWNVGNLKFSFVGIKNGATETQIEESNNTVPISRIESISTGEINYEKVGFVNKYSIAESYKINEDDILLSHINSLSMVGNIALKRDTSILYHGMNLLRLMPNKDKFDPKYLFWILKSKYFRNSVESIAKPAINQASVSIDSLKNISLLIPTKIEQQDIANFLDHETAKIDTLIEKQQQLIELLKEKRQAVISHAVTKGLNPNVPMKDSGVEWLGEVPEHWKLVPLKYLCSFSGGGTPTKDNLTYWTNGNIPWVSPKDMKTFWIKETQDYITEKAVQESSTNMVEPNSLLMVVRSGILQRTIPIAINIVPVTMNQDMKALKFGKRILVEYVANLIHGNTQQLLLEWSKEGATVESIEHEYLANSVIPVPPIEEQDAIVKLITKKMSLYRELTDKAELQISLLQERRTALISAAVTGKIDVRDWQHTNQKNEADVELSA